MGEGVHMCREGRVQLCGGTVRGINGQGSHEGSDACPARLGAKQSGVLSWVLSRLAGWSEASDSQSRGWTGIGRCSGPPHGERRCTPAPWVGRGPCIGHAAFFHVGARKARRETEVSP